MLYEDVKKGQLVKWHLQDAMRGPHVFRVSTDPQPGEKRSILVECISGTDTGEKFYLAPEWIELLPVQTEQPKE